jgi:hypothetical protein
MSIDDRRTGKVMVIDNLLSQADRRVVFRKVSPPINRPVIGTALWPGIGMRQGLLLSLWARSQSHCPESVAWTTQRLHGLELHRVF